MLWSTSRLPITSETTHHLFSYSRITLFVYSCSDSLLWRGLSNTSPPLSLPPRTCLWLTSAFGPRWLSSGGDRQRRTVPPGDFQHDDRATRVTGHWGHRVYGNTMFSSGYGEPSLIGIKLRLTSAAGIVSLSVSHFVASKAASSA